MRKMIEIWKPIKGYEGLYEVSNMGRVKSLNKVSKVTHIGNFIGEPLILDDGVLRGRPARHGYLRVALYDFNGGRKNESIHRLVADAFCDKRIFADKVNHINGTKDDNRAENLEWVTHQENIIHRFKELDTPERAMRRTLAKRPELKRLWLT